MSPSPKGGSGCSVVAALLALRTARAGRRVLLIDLHRDLARVLGCRPPEGPTLSDVVGLGPGVDPQALDDVSTTVAENLELVLGGDGPFGSAEPLLRLLDRDDTEVIVDVGPVIGAVHPWGCPVVAAADRAILVVRPCYLALSRCGDLPAVPTEVFVVREPGRAFDTATIAGAVGVPVGHELAHDVAIARAVDAGLLRSHGSARARWVRAL